MCRLREADAAGTVSDRVTCVAFDHGRRDLHEAMAGVVDGAMIWGGAEAVSSVRALPFPHWARLAVFGPRLSVAAMDAATWGNAGERASCASASPVTCGSSTSRPVPRPRRCSWSAEARETPRPS